MKQLTVGGLFSGVGGIELAFKQAGFKISWANDMDDKAHETYKKIMGHDHYIGNKAMPIEYILQNSYKEHFSYVDVLVGGFPCQAFSIAGYRKGFDDERGNAFFRIIDVLEYLKATTKLPRAILLENVKNFKTHDNKKTYNEVKRQLDMLGYSVYTKILNTKDYTEIPQNRERTFIICFKDESDWNEFALDERTDYTNEFEFNFFNQELLDNCKVTVSYDRVFRASSPSKFTSPIRDFLDLDEADPIYFYNEGKYFNMLSKLNARKNTFYQIRRVYLRENKSNVCPTLTANMGTGGHNVPIFKVKEGIFRKLTPRECFKLQGYEDVVLPNNMAKSHLYKQAGNSVTVPLVKIIAENIKKALESIDITSNYIGHESLKVL